MKEIYTNIENWLQQYPFIYNNLILLIILLGSYFSFLVTKVVLQKIVNGIVKKTKTEFDDILLNEKFLRKVSLIVPLIIINYASVYAFEQTEFVSRLTGAAITLLVVLMIGSILSSVIIITSHSDKLRDKPIKGYIQVIKIILYIFGIIVLIGILTGQSPWTLLTGVGALTAVIILVFKDTILSFVASIQISSYDLIKVGDWIEVPAFGADGDVTDIALHTVKVQNFDKTITVIPTYKLIETPFKNWRGMTLSGGRRIKRSIYIDKTSIKFCTKEMIERFGNIHYLKDYIEQKSKEIENYNNELKIDDSQIVNGRRMTNVGTFREYLKRYLENRKDISKDLTFLVRHLPPGPEGLPIELYIFTTTTNWVAYEDIQADIFDHIFAVVPQFGLRVYQKPTGHDLSALKEKFNEN